MMKKGLVFGIIVLFIGIAFTPNFGIIEVSQGYSNTEFGSVDILGWATLNVHVDAKDIFGNIVEPLDNVRVIARAIGPKRFQTLLCKANGFTNEHGDCELQVPVIKNEVMTYFVLSRRSMSIPHYKIIIPNYTIISIDENENKSINLELISFSWYRPLWRAILNVHVEKKTIFGNVPVKGASVLARAFAPECFAILKCRGGNTTDENGDCSILVRVIDDDSENTTFIVYSASCCIQLYLPAIGYMGLKPNDVKEVFLEFRRF